MKRKVIALVKELMCKGIQVRLTKTKAASKFRQSFPVRLLLDPFGNGV